MTGTVRYSINGEQETFALDDSLWLPNPVHAAMSVVEGWIVEADRKNGMIAVPQGEPEIAFLRRNGFKIPNGARGFLRLNEFEVKAIPNHVRNKIADWACRHEKTIPNSTASLSEDEKKYLAIIVDTHKDPVGNILPGHTEAAAKKYGWSFDHSAHVFSQLQNVGAVLASEYLPLGHLITVDAIKTGIDEPNNRVKKCGYGLVSVILTYPTAQAVFHRLQMEVEAAAPLRSSRVRSSLRWLSHTWTGRAEGLARRPRHCLLL